ncbi:neutral alpha-glucosidase C-like [Topomyia yanbarensis]|uniref:neutral alpha-glucosidase C-like n=1 Tax=Topomyia yanbarensis TaxID=2498891 RepID=UPI00273CEFFF|nr:neutral alpha-glucosidase C-like [Topomyia yanbarensis]
MAFHGRAFAYVALITLLNGIICVNHSTFKKCEQSAFCRRLRRTAPQESSFIAQIDTLQVIENVVMLDLLDTDTSHWYTLALSSVNEKSFHFEIDEKHPLNRRYRVQDSLAHKLTIRNITVESQYPTIVIVDGDKVAHIHQSPFRMDFHYENKLFVSVNSRGLLNVERLREKPDNPPEGEWEEEFNGFIDSKPRGPESMTLDFTFQQAEVMFGIPEHADDFILKDTVQGNSDPYRLYTLDVFGYELESKMALYGAVPVIYGHGKTGCSGIYWQNSAETWVDVFLNDIPTANFISESGIIDVFVLMGSSPVDVFQQYTSLTGTAPLPQMYALGYHQSRWNYDNESDVAMIDSKFEEHNIPLDSIWLDIEYTDGKRYFTWDYVRFPNPIRMINNLEANSRHLTIIIDPHVKIDPDYFFHKDCTFGGLYVRTKELEDFQGSCWPGPSSYTDFLNPEARKYYADRFLLSNFNESTRDVGIWNDMNEPSVFDGPEVTMQKDNIHYGGWEHRDVHNSYGHYHVMATYDGLVRRSEGTRRPFVLTRSHFAGTQRYSAVWTGDNMAEWGHLQASLKMCLSASVAGISFCGADVGGFFNEPSSELFFRWYQAAAFQPFFRGHAHEDTQRREPWLWPEKVKQIIRNAIQKRYRLLPLWYTMFYEHERYGAPIMRPLLTLYPTDAQAFKIDSQYLLGDQLLVAPVLEPGQTSLNVYFPMKENGQPDTWYDFDDYRSYGNAGYVSVPVDDFKIPVFQRAGTIVAVKNTIRKSTVLMKTDPYTLLVALDNNGSAKGTLYVDDEISFEYRNGQYVYIELRFVNGTLYSSKIDARSSFDTAVVFERIVFAGLHKKPNSVKLEAPNRNFTSVNVHTRDNISSIENLELSVKEEWKIFLL